jgi:hypothetical protein
VTRQVKRATTPAEDADRPTRPIFPSPPATTAREALIAEAIGDVGRLLDRIDPLVRALEESRAALANASGGLDWRVREFEVQVAAFTDRAKTVIVKHVERHSAEIVAQSNEAQTQAMRKAARQLFDEEVGPTLRQLTESLRRIVEMTLRPWDGWLTHLATAVTSAVLTGGVILFLHR